MSQINESWATLSQKERDEMVKNEREQKILALSKKYGKKKIGKKEKYE